MRAKIIKASGILLAGALIVLSLPAGSQAASKTPSLSKAKVDLTEGKNGRLSVKNRKGYTVSWKSNKKSVVTVSKTGLVKAKKKGAAKITAVVTNSKTGKAFRLICKVVVSGKSSGDSTQNADGAASGTEPNASVEPAGTVEPATTVKPAGTVEPAATVKPAGIAKPAATVKPAGTQEMPAPGETGATAVEKIDTTDAETLFRLEHNPTNRDIFDNQILFSYEQLQDMILQLKEKLQKEGVSWDKSYEIQEMLKRLEKIDAEFFTANALCVGVVELAQRGYDFTVDSADIRDRAGKKELNLILKEYWALPPDQCATCDCVYYSCFVRMPRGLIQGCDSVAYALSDNNDEEELPQLPPHYTTTPEAVIPPSIPDTGMNGEQGIAGRFFSYESDFPVLENQVVSDYGTLQEIIAQIKKGMDSSVNKELIRQLESYEEGFFKDCSLIIASHTETYGYAVNMRSVAVEGEDGNRVLHCNLQKQWTAGDNCVPCVMVYHNFVVEVPASQVSASDEIVVHPAVTMP